MGFFKRAARLHRNYSREEKDTSYSAPSIAALHSQLSLVSAATSSQSRSKMPPAPDPSVNPVAYLKSIHAVRDRSKLVMSKAKSNTLNHFDVDHSKFEETAKYVVSIIKRDYAPDYSKIPPHGRWQHFDVGGRPRIKQLLQSWPTTVNAIERTRRLLDLFVVSVLLDAGSGNSWRYKSKESGKVFNRSEGLAVASLEMFKAGTFSRDPEQPFQVDADGLRKVSTEVLAKGMQHSEENPLAGLEGRQGLLSRLADALQNTEFFGEDARPGNMLDYLLTHHTTQASSVPIIEVTTLWRVLMDGLGPVWPETRTSLNGVSLGDAWPCSDLPQPPSARPWEGIAPFHKLTQWLCYSLMAPMTNILDAQFTGTELLTGLPEYRNGGLLVDSGLLTLKPADLRRGLETYKNNAQIKGQPSVEVVPLFPTHDDVVVEWRALTVGFLDELLDKVNELLQLEGGRELSLAQMLEAGSWKGGREIAAVSRPNTREPPIMIISDGTVF